jgi:hypothetical protein
MSDRTGTNSHRYEAEIMIDSGHFVLLDEFNFHENHLDLLQRSFRADSWLAHAGHGGALFHAHEMSLQARVVVEVHHHAPAAELTPKTPESYLGTFSCGSGEVLLAAVTRCPGDITIHLPGAGDYHLYATRLPELATTSSGFENSAEQWIMHVWPVADDI